MKYLKKYKIFLEADNFDIEDSDTPDVKMSKERMNTVKSQMGDYKIKKSQIDTLYNQSENDSDIEDGLEKILGKTDVQNGVDRNPFLVEYAHLSKLERDINKLQNDNANDKVKLDDFQEQLSLSTEDTTKKAVEFKISDIKNRMSERSSKIIEIQKDLLDGEKLHKAKMLQMEKDMKKYIENISSSSEK